MKSFVMVICCHGNVLIMVKCCRVNVLSWYCVVMVRWYHGNVLSWQGVVMLTCLLMKKFCNGKCFVIKSGVVIMCCHGNVLFMVMCCHSNVLSMVNCCHGECVCPGKVVS